MGQGQLWGGRVSLCCCESSLSWQCPRGTCGCPAGAVAAQGVCEDLGLLTQLLLPPRCIRLCRKRFAPSK